jgi:hypothetical protein
VAAESHEVALGIGDETHPPGDDLHLSGEQDGKRAKRHGARDLRKRRSWS